MFRYTAMVSFVTDRELTNDEIDALAHNLYLAVDEPTDNDGEVIDMPISDISVDEIGPE